MTHQTTFAHAEFAAKKKTTRREKFLARMEEVIPWVKLLAVIEPHYPQGQRGRPPVGLERMLRVYVRSRIKSPTSSRVGLTHPPRRNSHVAFHHPLHWLVGEDDEKQHALPVTYLRRNRWVV